MFPIKNVCKINAEWVIKENIKMFANYDLHLRESLEQKLWYNYKTLTKYKTKISICI